MSFSILEFDGYLLLRSKLFYAKKLSVYLQDCITIMEQQSTTIPKPFSEEKLKLLLTNNLAQLAQKNIDDFHLPYIIKDNKLCDAITGADKFLLQFITQDAQMLEMKKHTKKLSSISDEVLILGETGTGKEIIARALHGDREGRFLAVNCGGLPEQLIESELFGHIRGAFTGADITKAGILREAINGTVFLDEIGELPLHVQAKLLRVIQERKVRAVGDTKETDINCRIVCATNRHIDKMSQEGTFRKDLYARISTFEISLKPLRERVDDIGLILDSLEGGKEFAAAWTEKKFASLDTRHNVRSLQQYVKRYNVLGVLPTMVKG